MREMALKRLRARVFTESRFNCCCTAVFSRSVFPAAGCCCCCCSCGGATAPVAASIDGRRNRKERDLEVSSGSSESERDQPKVGTLARWNFNKQKRTSQETRTGIKMFRRNILYIYIYMLKKIHLFKKIV